MSVWVSESVGGLSECVFVQRYNTMGDNAPQQPWLSAETPVPGKEKIP